MTTASESHCSYYLTGAVSLGHLTVGTSQSLISSIFAASVRLRISKGKTWSQTSLSFQVNGIESYLIATQLSWTGHVIHMDDYRIPKQILWPANPRFVVMGWAFQALQVQSEVMWHPLCWTGVTCHRSTWRTTCREAIDTFESNRLDQVKEKRQRRKLQLTAAATGFICDICRRPCGSRIGLFAHWRIHCWWDS